jgi:hypothetical protein
MRKLKDETTKQYKSELFMKIEDEDHFSLETPDKNSINILVLPPGAI